MYLFVKIISAFAIAVCASAANASTYKLDFSTPASLPTLWTETPYLEPITGSITFNALALGDTIESIKSIDLKIGKHSYTTNEIDFHTVFAHPLYEYWVDSAYYFGGLSFGYNGLGNATNDFMLSLSTHGQGSLMFTQGGIDGIWTSVSLASSYTEIVEGSAVPEPTSLTIMLLGLATLWHTRFNSFKVSRIRKLFSSIFSRRYDA